MSCSYFPLMAPLISKSNPKYPPIMPVTHTTETHRMKERQINSGERKMELENQELKNSDMKTEAVQENDGVESRAAAVKMQKVFRSYRTRRRLADSAVVAEELWWQAIEYARLNHSTASFYNYSKPETATSRWNRISLNASKVGKGLSKDDKAQKLAFQHWIEAIDPRHRYGHNLKVYYEEWSKRDAGQPFFYWLDIGDGKEIDLIECPRSRLRQDCIIYLGPQERECYEYTITEGTIVHKQTGDLLDTDCQMQGSSASWIFVMSTSKKLYAGQKRKGLFHHSSFLAGGATLAAGRLTVQYGELKTVSAYSGHYRPTEENLVTFLGFLKDSGIHLDKVQVISHTEEDYRSIGTTGRQEREGRAFGVLSTSSEQTKLEIPSGIEQKDSPEKSELVKNERTISSRRTASCTLQSTKTSIPEKKLLQSIQSTKEVTSYQLGHQLSSKWLTGGGPRIGCVADYLQNLRVQALEFLNLSFKEPPQEPPSQGLLGSYFTNICTVM